MEKDAPDPEAFVLCEREGRLDLRPPGESARAGIVAAFPPDQGNAGGKQNPLVRAFGPRITAVYDLTAGLGADAYRLAAAGYSVRGFERNPAVYALLASGWAHAKRSGAVPGAVIERLDFEYAEAKGMMGEVQGLDVGVYFDPMYPPPKRQSALPKRELQVLRALLPVDHTEAPAALIQAARQRAARVVVKRPHHAEPILPGASFELESKLVRFDVYMNPERMSEGKK
ncbi:MAG: class I SAM-dependent methyltransferase [Myxococcota bacterium]